ncbi:MAG: hypothetical protein ABI867_13665 [Kofleriaceae bacterium]
MNWRNLIIVVVAATACGNKAEVARAKRSVYDTDFAVVYQAVLESTRELYPNITDHPGAGAIKTAWHQVSYANNQDDMTGNRSLSTSGTNNIGTSPAAGAAGMPTRLAYKRFFIRFDLLVAGGRPWRVRVVGHASEWDPGAAMPVELVGPARPPWLDGRIDALTVAIYKKMKKVAVAMKDEPPPVKPEDLIPKTDPKSFANVPPEAAKRLAALKDAVSRREYTTLRAQLFDDVAWSLGGEAGADTAMAMWQADPESLDAMVKVMSGKCTSTDKKVMCPAGDPVPGQWQLVLELRDVWKVASFVKAE